jgi:DNA-binding response OmpR family regulator
MKLLVVEDEISILNFLKPSLENEFYNVDIATDGEEGLAMALNNNYDLIILDIMLPKMNGDEICQALRTIKNDVPVIMLSAIAEAKKKVELFNCGADDYVTKPFSFEELLARIKALLRRPKKIESDILQIDSLYLDKNAKTVFRGDSQIHLTRKEFLLLEYLMENYGIVLSRGMIMEKIWDMNADPFSNTIESHIASLRRKINHHRTKKEELIQTISGRGYVMLKK